MTVTVTPETFTLVFYDSAAIAATVEELASRLGLTDDIHIVVDESTPLARISATRDGAVVKVAAESGALEDTKRPRRYSANATVLAVGRVLLRLRDREDGSFTDAPADDQLSLSQIAAWDSYSIGRLEQLGYVVYRPRFLYNFRNRHGFSDATDEVFERVFTAEHLTWGQLDELSHSASIFAG